MAQLDSGGRASIQCGDTEPSGRPASSVCRRRWKVPRSSRSSRDAPVRPRVRVCCCESESGCWPRLGQPSPGSQLSVVSMELQGHAAWVKQGGQSRETWQDMFSQRQREPWELQGEGFLGPNSFVGSGQGRALLESHNAPATGPAECKHLSATCRSQRGVTISAKGL